VRENGSNLVNVARIDLMKRDTVFEYTSAKKRLYDAYEYTARDITNIININAKTAYFSSLRIL
jgi:hypothetical protein